MQDITRLPKKVGFIESTGNLSEQANYLCYCCEDTGFVVLNLIKLVIPDYNESTDHPPVCNRYGCNSAFNKLGAEILHSDFIDNRFDQKICQDLDVYRRKEWKQWEKNNNQILEKIKKIEGEI